MGIGYPEQEHDTERQEWVKHGIVFHFAKDIPHAAKCLEQSEYICIAIRGDQVSDDDLMALREAHAIPIVMLPPVYTAAERHACTYLSAIQYLRASGHTALLASGSEHSVQSYLELPREEREPMTIITVKDLSFCLEYRSVEICGMEVALTEKEFDILALLITNQRRVFTHEAIMDAVWHEDISFYSPKAITTHISNLRKKLKITPDAPEYIQSVRGVGYKFTAPE